MAESPSADTVPSPTGSSAEPGGMHVDGLGRVDELARI